MPHWLVRGSSGLDILDVAPEDQIASENMWTTEELADKGMAGLYFPFYATQLSSTQLRRAIVKIINIFFISDSVF